MSGNFVEDKHRFLCADAMLVIEAITLTATLAISNAPRIVFASLKVSCNFDKNNQQCL